MENSFPTYDSKIDMQILSYIPDSKLSNMCQIDTYTAALCKRNELWELKLVNTFGSNILQYRDKNQTFRELYHQLISTQPIAIEGRWSKRFLLRAWANQAVKEGFLNILNWLFDEHMILPTGKIPMLHAVTHGQLNVIKWLKEHNISISHTEMRLAAKYGHLNVINWLNEHNIPLDRMSIRIAAGNGQLEVLKLANPALFDNFTIDAACLGGHLEIVRWLEQRGIHPNFSCADSAAMNGHLNILTYLEQQHIFPTQ